MTEAGNGDGVLLRPFTYRNGRLLFTFSSEVVCRYMEVVPFADRDEAEEFLTQTIEKVKQKSLLRYSVLFNGEFAGTVNLYESSGITRGHRSATRCKSSSGAEES